MRLYTDGIRSLVSNYIFLMVVIRLDRENSTRAIQIQPKAVSLGCTKAFTKIEDAKKKPIVGDRYCKNPSTFNGKSFAPYEKRMSGIDVVSPAPMRSRPVDVTFSRKTQEEVSMVAKYHSAIGVTSHASKAYSKMDGW